MSVTAPDATPEPVPRFTALQGRLGSSGLRRL